MRVRCSVGEPDIEAIVPGSKANVYLDAYPDLVLPAHFEFASPVASAGLNSPIKTFTAVFRIDKTDPHLLPDLSAAVVLQPQAATATPGAQPDKSGADAPVRAQPPGRALALVVNPSARQDNRK